MKFGLSDKDYHFIQREVVQPLKKMGATVWCYGSRARGDHQNFSDLDLMIESSQDLTTEIGAIQEKISNSNFPYKVDLVQWANFAEAYRPGYIQDRVSF